MKRLSIAQLLERKKYIKAHIEELLLQRPSDVGFQWQSAQENLAAVNTELASRDNMATDWSGHVVGALL